MLKTIYGTKAEYYLEDNLENENNPKNENDLENKDEPQNEDDSKNKDKHKNDKDPKKHNVQKYEDSLNMYDNLKNEDDPNERIISTYSFLFYQGGERYLSYVVVLNVQQFIFSYRGQI